MKRKDDFEKLLNALKKREEILIKKNRCGSITGILIK